MGRQPTHGKIGGRATTGSYRETSTQRGACLEAGIEWTTRQAIARGANKQPEVAGWLAKRIVVSYALDGRSTYVIAEFGDACIVTDADFLYGGVLRQNHLAQGLFKSDDPGTLITEKILSQNRAPVSW